MNDLRRAYAALGLPEGAPLDQVKSRYRSLVKTWHPDRFESDPDGQAEASARLQVINAAYAKLERSFGAPGMKARTGTASRRRPQSVRRLTRAEIDTLVSAIGTESPLDGLFSAVGRVGHPLESFVGSVLSFVRGQRGNER